jgi:hypothetical protein
MKWRALMGAPAPAIRSASGAPRDGEAHQPAEDFLAEVFDLRFEGAM